MILRLVKRDPAWQMALVFAVVMGVAAPLFPYDPARFNIMLLVATAVLGGSLQARPHIHATLFEAALHITGRDLFLARTLSLLAMVWLPVFCGVIAILLVRADGPLALAMVEAAAILTPLILVQQAIRVREIAGPQWPYWLGWPLVWAVGGAWHFLSPGVVLSICGLVSAALLIRTWLAVPPSLQVVSLKVVDPIAVPTAPVARTAFTWLPVLRSAFWWGPPFYFLLMVLQGMTGVWLLFVYIFTVQGALQSRRRTRWLSALPLSYRALLWITLASTVVPLLAGLAVGLCFSQVHSDYPLTSAPWPHTNPGVNVSLEFWHYAPSSKVPIIRAPWGETAQPATFRALGCTFYNPYTIGSGNSRQFLEWQFGRATQAVYGRSIHPMQYGAAYRAGLKSLTDRPQMRILTWEAAALLSLFLVFATELSGWHVLHRPPARGAAALMLMLFAIVIAPACAILVYSMLHGSVSIFRTLVHWVLLRVTSALPNTLLAATAAALPVGAMYWLLERQFRKSELPMWKWPGQPE